MVFTGSQIKNLSKEELIQLSVVVSYCAIRKKTVSNAQYHRRETLELNPVPQDIQGNVLEDTIYKALSLTGQEVILEDLHPCHRMSNHDGVIVEFKDRKLKHNVQIKRKKLSSKIFRALKIKILGKTFCEGEYVL